MKWEVQPREDVHSKSAEEGDSADVISSCRLIPTQGHSVRYWLFVKSTASQKGNMNY